jgi:hypothetical protein
MISPQLLPIVVCASTRQVGRGVPFAREASRGRRFRGEGHRRLVAASAQEQRPVFGPKTVRV